MHVLGEGRQLKGLVSFNLAAILKKTLPGLH